VIASATQTGLGGYVILFVSVAASWIGIPVIGAGVLAAAGVLASEGELNIWIVIAVSTVAAWTGGYVGYRLGLRAGGAVAEREGRWHRPRRRAMAAGERIYRRWGRLAVFLTPTWVSGAMRMPRGTFLLWNAVAAIVSNCVAALGAYGIGAALLGRLSERRGTIALAVAAVAIAAVTVAVVHGRVHARAAEEPPEGHDSKATPRHRRERPRAP
jgi:membrane-associated protein